MDPAMRRPPLTIFTTIATNPTASAAIINMVVTEMKITFNERLRSTSIPVRPFSPCALSRTFQSRNVRPGIEAEKIVLVSACTCFSRAEVPTGRPGDLRVPPARCLVPAPQEKIVPLVLRVLFERCLAFNRLSLSQESSQRAIELPCGDRRDRNSLLLSKGTRLRWHSSVLPLETEFLLAMDGVQDQLQVGRRRDFVLSYARQGETISWSSVPSAVGPRVQR